MRKTEALAIELQAASDPIEVQSVKTVRPVMGRQVLDADGGDMEEEAFLPVRGAARRRTAVDERRRAGLRVKLGADERNGGLAGAERCLRAVEKENSLPRSHSPPRG